MMWMISSAPTGCQVSLLGDQHVDELPELVDCPVQIDPSPGDLGVCFVDEQAITGRMSTRSCCVDQQWCEALHPPEDRNVIDSDAALGQQFFHVSGGQPCGVPKLDA